MKKETTRLVAVLGFAGALILAAMPPSFAAATRTTHHAKTSTTNNMNASSDKAFAQEPAANDTNDMNLLPGYSANPQGMCWFRQGGGGQDLSGYWDKCPAKSQ
jgi:hypothetical protein